MAHPAPQQDGLGYERALDLGVTGLEHGLTAAAVSYLQQAVSYRPTRFALVQLAKAHRDLGQLGAARDRLEQARALPDGADQFVLVTLAAVLCDLREHGSAFEVAMEAARLEPKNGATLSVLARCMKESASILGSKDHIDQSAVKAILVQAEHFAKKAREAQPESIVNLKDRRRERAAQAWSIPVPPGQSAAPLEQVPATVLHHSSEEETDGRSIAVPVAELDSDRDGPFQRLWHRLRALAK